MASLFLRQFGALFWKNWIVLSKHPLLNVLRCFLLPVGYGVFLAVAQIFLSKPNNYGIGTIVPIRSLVDVYDSSYALIWADGTNGAGSPSADDIMTRITRDFSTDQMNNVKKLGSPDDIPAACPQNFNLFSECFAAVAFNALPANDTDPTPIDYTIRADGGLVYINAPDHTSDIETRTMPLQFALDQAIIEFRTGQSISTPLELPFTQETNEEQSTAIRLSYIRGLRTLLVLALFVCYVGIAYQLPGSFMSERANLLTSHLKAMGLLDSARMISWHVSISLAYLPAWIIVAIVWHYRIFLRTNVGLVIIIHLLFGWSLASWSLFVSAPFGSSPQLAAVASTILSIVFAILALVDSRASTVAAFVYSVIFPPGYYIFVIRAVCGWENNQIETNIVKGDPDNGLMILPLLIAAIIDVFLWPWLAILLEHRLYDAPDPRSRLSQLFTRKRSRTSVEREFQMPEGTAISIRNLRKTFKKGVFSREKGIVTAVGDLSLDIPKNGIHVLLGANGAGKSTTLSILANLLGRTSGLIRFEGNTDRPPRGFIGIVPQKNVLFPELSCYQTLRVWKYIKPPTNENEDDVAQLLRDCDLGKKIHANANNLSGGQKRKLQLAIGLIGGSRIVLVDECTSGVDPLSRRALWKTLLSVRHERTVVFTTHFLDEADLLADTIAIIAAPGKKVAEGTPVWLKSNLGEGYTVQVTLKDSTRYELAEKEVPGPNRQTELLRVVKDVAPSAYTSSSSRTEVSYHLNSKDPEVVENVLRRLDKEGATHGVLSYDVHSSSIEDIFLGLMSRENEATAAEPGEGTDVQVSPRASSADTHEPISYAPPDALDGEPVDPQSMVDAKEKATPRSSTADTLTLPSLSLSDGRKRSPFSQALTIFHKRWLIARRSWLTSALTILVAIAGSCIPLFFMDGRAETCITTFRTSDNIPLFWPDSPLAYTDFGPGSELLIAPPNVTSILGSSNLLIRKEDVTDNATFIQTIQQNYRDISFGGVSFDEASGNALFAWEGTSPGFNGLAMLNFATNLMYQRALSASGRTTTPNSLIEANYEAFPPIDAGLLVALKWVAFFGAAMSVYPAFFSLYVSRERRSAVQAMQLSNGLSDPVGLWLGHLMFDSIFSVIISTIIIIIFAAVSNQFQGLGFFWLILVLYGMVGALFSYCVSMLTASPLAAFAASAGYQIVMFVLYLAGYLLVLTYAKTSEADNDLTRIHFTLSILSPVANVLRTSFISVNLFSLLCTGITPVTTSAMGDILRYGGPILYLIVYALVLFGILVWVDSGSIVRRRISASRARKAETNQVVQQGGAAKELSKNDVIAEAEAVTASDDPLRVLHITKSFEGADNKVVDDVSFGVSSDTVFALLGPNGAGKTTTFNMIRGDVVPNAGDILIKDTSVIQQPRTARLSLGVCPQFTAIDTQLTVREHLLIYGRLKGLRRGEEVSRNVEMMMQATALDMYADRLASQLSGGNQRKLALAIALIGNPSVILIDEFSTGIDAKMKREMWGTLRNVAVGKAVVITTHSMEEASALANKVGILARRMLAVGTTTSLVSRYASYEVHFSCRNREEVLKAQQLMSRIVPSAKMKDDVATRFEVPIYTQTNASGQEVEQPESQSEDSERLTLAKLFHLLASQGDFAEYTVERASLESVFLRVIRENEVEEEEGERRKVGWVAWLKRCI